MIQLYLRLFLKKIYCENFFLKLQKIGKIIKKKEKLNLLQSQMDLIFRSLTPMMIQLLLIKIH